MVIPVSAVTHTHTHTRAPALAAAACSDDFLALLTVRGILEGCVKAVSLAGHVSERRRCDRVLLRVAEESEPRQLRKTGLQIREGLQLPPAE